jgi:hypothetical protein
MEMALVMGWHPRMKQHGGGAGDIAQLRYQWLESSLTIRPDETDTPHRTRQELTALELNHRAPTQPGPVYLHEDAAVRATSGNGDVLAQ